MKSKWIAVVIVPMVATFSCNGTEDDKNETGNINDSTGDTNGSDECLSFDSESVQDGRPDE